VNNSIISNLEPSTAVSEIRLLLNSPLHKDKTFVLVEGDDDIVLFQTLLSDKTVLVRSYGSCTAIDKILSKHFKSKSIVIGIRDKDYQQKKASNKSFYCYYTCMELMLIANDVCMQKLCINIYKGTESFYDLRRHILDHLNYLSCIRYINFIKSWNIRFDGLKPGKHYSTDIKAMNDNIVKEINKQNNNSLNLKRKKTVDSGYKKNCALPELLNLVNGHDFLNLFLHICKFENKKASIISCEIAMRCSFGINEFKTTNLYQQLQNHQNKNNLFIV
jgi:hypothetical protein